MHDYVNFNINDDIHSKSGSNCMSHFTFMGDNWATIACGRIKWHDEVFFNACELLIERPTCTLCDDANDVVFDRHIHNYRRHIFEWRRKFIGAKLRQTFSPAHNRKRSRDAFNNTHAWVFVGWAIGLHFRLAAHMCRDRIGTWQGLRGILVCIFCTYLYVQLLCPEGQFVSKLSFDKVVTDIAWNGSKWDDTQFFVTCGMFDGAPVSPEGG
jgi:hypothetical protein